MELERSEAMELADAQLVESAAQSGMVTEVKEEEIVIYKGASELVLDEKAETVLGEKVDDNDVEIRPDGLLYLPQTFVRDRLNRAFGRGQWAIIQIKTFKMGSGEQLKVGFDGALYVRGKFVARATGEAEYHENNPMQSWASVVESAKSDAIVRCCKDLGVAKELWSPRFGREWQKKYAVQVWREKTGRKRDGSTGSFQWRRKDTDPFYDEKGKSEDHAESSKSTQSTKEPPKSQQSQAETPLPEAQTQKDGYQFANSDYVIPFGVFKGKKISELTEKEAKSTAKWCRDKGKYLDVAEKIEAFLSDSGMPKINNAPPEPKKPESSPVSSKSDDYHIVRGLIMTAKSKISLKGAIDLATKKRDANLLTKEEWNSLLKEIEIVEDKLV